MQPQNLLIAQSETYVYASWRVVSSETEVIAIYRKHADRWTLEQVRGPFSVVENGHVVNVQDKLFAAASVEAVSLLENLNSGVDITHHWSGNVVRQ